MFTVFLQITIIWSISILIIVCQCATRQMCLLPPVPKLEKTASVRRRRVAVSVGAAVRRGGGAVT